MSRHIYKSTKSGWFFQILTLILALAIWLILAFRYGNWLIRLETKSLFLYTTEFLTNNISTAGGMLTYISAFLTQFLHLPALGAALWVSGALFLSYLTFKTFRLTSNRQIFAVIPSALALAAVTGLGYQIFLIDCSGWFFEPLVGSIAAISGINIFQRLSSLKFRLAAIIIWTLAGFPLFGLYALTATMAMILLTAKHTPTPFKRILSAVLSCATVAITPFLWYNIFTTETITGAYTAGLPYLANLPRATLCRLPYFLIPLYIMVLALLPLQKNNNNDGSSSHQSIVIPGIITVITVAFNYICWFNDPLYRTECKMATAVDNLDWQGVLDAENDFETHNPDRTAEPSRPMVLYRNLALAKAGSEGKMAYRFRDGQGEQKCARKLPLIHQCGKELYYHYGLSNYSFRWSMEEVARQGQSNGTLKYQVMSSIVSGDSKRAATYIKQLKHTLFYRKWAKRQELLAKDIKKMQNAGEYASVLPLMCIGNELAMDHKIIEVFLANHFTTRLQERTTPEFDRIALQFALSHKQPALFWNHLVKYLHSNNVSEIPVAYQEAALLYGALTDIPSNQLQYSNEVLRRWNEFQDFAENHPNNNGEDLDEYYRCYNDTYWYFHYFVSGITTY